MILVHVDQAWCEFSNFARVGGSFSSPMGLMEFHATCLGGILRTANMTMDNPPLTMFIDVLSNSKLHFKRGCPHV